VTVFDDGWLFEDEPALTVQYEPCELCGHLMPEGAIGWHPECRDQADGGGDGFFEWGGWRRAFGEYTDAEWAARPRCRFEVTNA